MRLPVTFRLPALLGGALLLAACNSPDPEPDYLQLDSGRASPAMAPTLPGPGGADSTAGYTRRVGEPGVAGTRIGESGDSGILSTSPQSSTPVIGGKPPRPIPPSPQR